MGKFSKAYNRHGDKVTCYVPTKQEVDDEILRDLFANGGPMRPTKTEQREIKTADQCLIEEQERLARSWNDDRAAMTRVKMYQRLCKSIMN